MAQRGAMLSSKRTLATRPNDHSLQLTIALGQTRLLLTVVDNSFVERKVIIETW